LNSIKKIQSRMKESKIEALLCTGEISRLYALNFDSSAGMALLFRNEAYFLTDFRYLEMAKRAISGCEVLLVTGKRGYFAIINELLAQKRIKRLHVEDKVLSVFEFDRYKSMAEAELLPAGDILNRLRAVKESWELERIEKAQRVSEKVLDRVTAFIRPGVRDIDIKAEIEYRFIKEGCTAAFETIVAVGKNSSMPHAKANGRVVDSGDFVTIDMGARYKGYCSDMTRTFAVGSADAEMRKVYEVVLEAQLAALASAREGVPYPAVDRAARDIIENEGYGGCFGHGLGHGVGLEIHEDLYASPEEGGLKAGSVLTFEPGIYLEGRFGVRIEDFGVITQSGVDNLTNFPKELIVL